MNNIFVGNLSFKATKEDLVKLFEPFGIVANAVIVEKKKGKSRGFGFVDMTNEGEKSAAIAALQGKEFMWRVLSVSPVVPKIKSAVKTDHRSKPSRKGGRTPGAVNTSEGASKYYSKFDGPPKPWRKANKDSKPSPKKDEGSRPYYGKKDRKFAGQSKPLTKREEGSKFSNKPKISKGFKMFHKVSGASKTRPKTGTDGL